MKIENWSTFAEIIAIIKVAYFFRDTVYLGIVASVSRRRSDALPLQESSLWTQEGEAETYPMIDAREASGA